MRIEHILIIVCVVLAAFGGLRLLAATRCRERYAQIRRHRPTRR